MSRSGCSALSWLLALAVVAPACSFDPRGTPAGLADGGGDDDDLDGGDDDDGSTCSCPIGCEPGTATCLPFAPSNLDDLTALDDVTAGLTLDAGTWVLDTKSPALLDPGGVEIPGLAFSVGEDGREGILVLAVDQLTITAGATLRGVGPRPILILSRGAIVVDGTVDVSAGCTVDVTAAARDRVWCGGPGGGDGGRPEGSNDRTGATGCAPGGNGDAGAVTAERGGGGGGFGTAGGHGGGFDSNGSDSEGGAACGAATLEPLGGGSGGGTAGYKASGSDDNRTAGGGGGGAVQLTSRTSVIVRGVIDAGGEGGAGTAQAGSVHAARRRWRRRWRRRRRHPARGPADHGRGQRGHRRPRWRRRRRRHRRPPRRARRAHRRACGRRPQRRRLGRRSRRDRQRAGAARHRGRLGERRRLRRRRWRRPHPPAQRRAGPRGRRADQSGARTGDARADLTLDRQGESTAAPEIAMIGR